MSAAFSIRDFLLHIYLNSSSCHNVLILLSLSGVTNLSLLVGVCAACMLAYKCWVYGWSCGCIGTVDSGPKCAHSWNQTQTLKDCLFCHNYCAQLWLRMVAIVTASCAVSNRVYQYPLVLEIQTGFPPGFFCVSRTCHNALCTKNREKVSVSVFVTVFTV